MSAPHILVVADDRSTSQAMERALGPTGVFVHAATGASAALTLLGQHSIAVMFIDVDRRDAVSATEFTQLVRDRKPDVDIVAIAKTPTAAIAMDVIRAGAADCLGKTALTDRIGGFIDGIMERRCYRHEQVPWPDQNLEDSAIIGHDPKLIDVYKQVVRLARSNDPILIVGERGTGKMAVARAIHSLSRADEPFAVLESTSIADGIAESELFGHVQGAFTDAKRDRKGYFERAGRGTLVIDELADLSRAAQGKLLRVLQERELIPVGGTVAIMVHARAIAITNRPLELLVKTGEFRPDLYDRLLVGMIEVPPLRDRRGDIPELAHHFTARAAKQLTLPTPPFIVPAALDALVEYDWPGNVRELENMTKQAVLNAAQYTAHVILVQDFDLDRGRRSWTGARPNGSVSLSEPISRTADDDRSSGRSDGTPSGTKLSVRPFADAERDHVNMVLQHVRWNKTRAAAILEISRTRLDRLIDRHGIERTDHA